MATKTTPDERPLKLHQTYDNYGDGYPTKAAIAQNGHPGYLTEEQEKLVDELRQQLEDKKYKRRLDTITLLRFLRARQFDLERTLKMFEDCETWRKDTMLDDTIAIWDYPEKAKVFEYYPQYYHKTDKDGRPVYIESLANVDIVKLGKITTNQRMLTNLAVEYELVGDPRLPACSRKSGHLLETCCTIMDLKGVSIMKASSVYGYLKEASNMSQNYYPERLGKLYIINAPWGFSTVWNMVKGWLDEVTVNKIHILGGSYVAPLLEQIPAENLPKAFGGTCACPGGCELSDMGPWKEDKWSRPSWWEKLAAEGRDGAVIENGPGVASDGKPAITVVDGSAEAATATAAA